MVAYSRKRKASSTVYKGRVAKKPRLTAKRVMSIAKKAVLKQSETKLIEQSAQETGVTSNGGNLTNSCCTLAQGTGQTNRIGNKVVPIGIDIRGHVINNVQNRPLIVKMMVVRQKDMLANRVTELLENNLGNQSASTNSISKMYQRINRESFEVLHTKYITLQGADHKQFKIFKAWVPLRKLKHLTYEGAGSADPNYNDIFLIFFGADAENDAVNNTFEISYCRTFYFKDP